MKTPRTIEIPAEFLPLRVRVRQPSGDRPGELHYLVLEVSATGCSFGSGYEKTCSSERCCGRPKAPAAPAEDAQEVLRV
jgi:hypothetical protein